MINVTTADALNFVLAACAASLAAGVFCGAVLAHAILTRWHRWKG
jgi:hypothetical protein